MDKVKIGCPIDYTDNEDIERTGLFLREPEIEELEKRLKEINKITDLEQQCKKQKEVIDKINHYIEKQARMYGLSMPIELGTHLDNILSILKEVS